MKASEILLELGNAIYPYTQAGNKLVAQLKDGRVLDLAFWRTGTELEIIFGVDDETEMTGGGDQFKIMVIPFEDRARDEAADAAETIDRNFGSHIKYSL